MTTPEQKRAALLRIKQFFTLHKLTLPSDALFLEPMVDDLAKILKNQDHDYVAPPVVCSSQVGDFQEHTWLWMSHSMVYQCKYCGQQKAMDSNGVKL